jgi:hypothetical protein
MRTTVTRAVGVALGVLVAGSIMAATTGITTRQARTAAPAAVTAGASSAEGSSLAFARADHVHPASGFAPATTGSSLLRGDGSGGFNAFAGTGSRPASSWLAGLSASGVPTWAQIDWTDLSGKPLTFAPSSHSHPWSMITERPTTFTPNAADADTTGGIRLAGDLTGVFTAPEVVDNSHSHTGLTVTNVTVPWSLVTERPTNFTPPAADVDTMGGIQLTGDLSGYYTGPQVVNDSHSHTSATVSSVGFATDAGTLDTIDSTGFVRQSGSVPDLNATGGDNTVSAFRSTFQATNRPGSGNYAAGATFGSAAAGYRHQMSFSSTDESLYIRKMDNSAWGGWRKLWHDANDGSGSTLDADLFDGADASSYLRAVAALDGDIDSPVYGYSYFDPATIGRPSAYGTLLSWNGLGGTDLTPASGKWLYQLAIDTLTPNMYLRTNINGGGWAAWGKFWTSSNDGIASGLDADTLDGMSSGAFSTTGHAHDGTTISGLDAGDVTTGTFAPPRLGTCDLAAFLPGKPAASVVLARLAITRPTRLPAGLGGSVSYSGVNATSSSAVTLRKRTAAGVTSSIGYLTWSSANSTPSVSFTSAVDFSAGDFLEFFSPSNTDATLADLSITLVATKL